jgi:hypothetical protein
VRRRRSVLDPPEHAIVLSVDEKSRIQALDRTQKSLPLFPGRLGTMTHDYTRAGCPKNKLRILLPDRVSGTRPARCEASEVRV